MDDIIILPACIISLVCSSFSQGLISVYILGLSIDMMCSHACRYSCSQPSTSHGLILSLHLFHAIITAATPCLSSSQNLPLCASGSCSPTPMLAAHCEKVPHPQLCLAPCGPHIPRQSHIHHAHAPSRTLEG